MDLREYINEILLHRDFIIIPELGGFVCEYKSAKINVDKSSIAPPSKDIVFKNTLVHDDDELNKYIQKTQKVDKKKASVIIKDFVASVKEKILNGEEVEIPGIGHLYGDNNKKVQFRTEIKSNLLLDSYGMSKTKVKPLQRETVKTTTNTVQATKKPGPINNKSSNNNDMGTNKKKSLGWIIAIVLIAAGIALILIPQYTPYLQDLKIDFAKLFNKNKEHIAKTDSSEISQELDNMTNKKDALYYEEENSQKITGDNIPESLISNYTQYSNFYIIAGSYKKRRNADILKAKLSKEGYDSQILISTERNLYRVSYKSFTDRRTAIKELYRLQKELNNEEIWILNI